MSVYVSYTDESESRGQKTGKFLIAGYVADELKWPEFSKRWQEEVLASIPAIPYLHMVNMRSESWREECGITRAEASDKIYKAAQIIAETNFITGYYAPISEQAYLKALQVFVQVGPKSERYFSRIDYLCFIAYSLGLIKALAREHQDLRKVVFNISKKKPVSHHLQHVLHDAMIEKLLTLNPSVAALFGEVVPLDMRNHMPLQAADMLCWHLQRIYVTGGNESDPEFNRNAALLERRNLYEVPIPDSALETLAQDIARIAAEEKENEPEE